MHKTKVKIFIRSQIILQLHILRCVYSCIMQQRPNQALILVSQSSSPKMTTRNNPVGFKMNSDSPQRTPVGPLRSHDAWIRVSCSHFFHTKNTVKKVNYGHRTSYNLLTTVTDSIISPDISCIVHKAKGNFIYSKRLLPQLRILRCVYSCILQQRPNQALILVSQSSSPKKDATEQFRGV